MSADPNPSVPRHERRPPRALDDEERTSLLAIADALMPDADGFPAPSRTPGYERWLERALAARYDAFADVVAVAGVLGGRPPEELLAALRRVSEDEPVLFTSVSSVLAGAYLLVPEVRRAIGYPGQERRPAPFDQAAEEIMSGILDPVIERGPVYVDAPGAE